MNRSANQTDERIDQVLNSLRRAEPSADMEDRILRRLEAHTAARPQSGSRNYLPTWILRPTVTTFVAASLSLTLLLIAASILFPTRRFATTSTQFQTAATPAALSSPQPAPVVPQRSKRHLTAQTIRGSTAKSTPQADLVSEEEALAISEMLAPSKPAPPLPLTRQEQLLAEVVHRGEPEELASLRPDVRAKQMELSKSEFHDFFKSPPAKANE